jgi:hypothetical protein
VAGWPQGPLAEELSRFSLGSVAGGDTSLGQDGEIENCDVAIEVREISPDLTASIIQILERLGAPKGSKLAVAGQWIDFGSREGLGLYLNGTDLPMSVYETSDVNWLYHEIDRRLAGCGKIYSHRDGPRETALYMYGSSYGAMRERIQELVDTYPLCQQCRVLQIA